MSNSAVQADRRAWIRNTYKRYSNVYSHNSNTLGTILVLFVMPKPQRWFLHCIQPPMYAHTLHPPRAIDAAVLAEELWEHRDVVLLDTVPSTAEEQAYAWMTHAWHTYGLCRSLRWVGKVGLDTYIRTVQLEKLMRSPPMQHMVWG